MIFGIVDGAVENVKIIICVMQNLSLPLDRARQIVLGTDIGTGS
jgi:hypothetical protein